MIGAALLIALPFICGQEGTSLKAYQDTAKVWTVCSGIAHVPAGTVETKPQCDAMTKNKITGYMNSVYDLSGEKQPDVLAAYTSFAYNIGLSAFARSQTLKLEKSGDLAGSCSAMMHWVVAGGKDCRIRSNNCYGLVTRREAERDLCLKGLQPKGAKP